MFAVLTGVWIASLLGSPHCVGMCGPFVALTVVRRGPATAQPRGGADRRVLAYNLGRLLAYTTIGMLAGGLGAAIDAGGRLAGAQRTATTLAGIAMICVGVLQLLAHLGWSERRSRASAAVGRLAHALGRRAESWPAPARAVGLGLATSLMPCGWLYVFAVAAAGTASPWLGAATMAAFWLGTLPALTLFGAVVARLSQRARRALPVVGAFVILGVGIFTLVMRAPIELPSPAQTPSPSSVPGLDTTPPCHRPAP